MKVKRAIDTQTTLSKPSVQPVVLKGRSVQTYKIPRMKTLLKASFWARGRCNCHMNGIGRTRSAASVMMFGIELPSKNWLTLTPHVKLPGAGGVGANRVQNAFTGWHWNMVIRI